MTWGDELWDQYDNLSSHTQRGIDFLERFCQFIKDRCSIEVEYASKLRRLVKNYQPKKKEEDDYQFSSWKAFVQVMNEVNDIAGQHEVIAEDMTSHIARETTVLLKELKEERKKHLQEGSRLQNALSSSLAQLEKTKKAYEKAYKEADKAQDHYTKADADLNLSRAEVEKARNAAAARNQVCEECKTDYANQLQKTNELQKVHFEEHMPKVFEQLQDMDERRVTCLQNFIKQKADIHRKVIPIINQCLDGMVKAAESIDSRSDSQMVIEKYKSGFLIPNDHPFEDLSMAKINEPANTLPNYPHYKNETVKGTVSGNKLKKRGGIFSIFGNTKNHVDETKEDFSDLPPNQRQKKLQMKIDSITKEINQEHTAREALLKMKSVYESNTAMGDPVSIEAQLVQNRHKLEKLETELKKYQNYLSDVDAKPLTPNTNKRDRSSISEDSLSRSASDSSVCNPYNNNNNNKTSAPGTPLPAHGSSNSPESGIGTSHTSIPDADVEGDFDNGEVTEMEDPLPVLGTARALYPFEAQSEGSIPMAENEEFEVVELDQGDGWTRVRKANLEEGFVPSSYIECYLYNNC